MNAPENCGRAPPQVCAGGAFGPQAKPSPAGDGFSGLRPLAPAAPGRPAARLSPCRNPAFIFNTNRIIQSNLYSFRQISRPLPFGRSASFAKVRIHRAKSMQGASLGNGRSPTPPRALCQAKEPGRSPLRLRRKRRPFRPAWPPFGRPGLRPALFSAFIQLVLYRQIILTFDRIPHGFAITNAVYHFCRIKTPQNNSVKENQK